MIVFYKDLDLGCDLMAEQEKGKREKGKTDSKWGGKHWK